jgi:hypothetical protein
MSCEPHVTALGALLSACRIHGNVEMAECAAKRILELQPENASAYVLLSMLLVATGVSMRMFNSRYRNNV